MSGPIVPTRDRLWEPFRKLVAILVAPTRFYGRYGYTISNPTLKTIDATPIDNSLGLPSLQGVAITADAISTYKPPPGGECHIMFRDGNPALPICVWTDGTATVVNVLGGPNPVAYVGSQVTSFLPPSAQIIGTANGLPFVGTLVSPLPISGTVVQGSQLVNSA